MTTDTKPVGVPPDIIHAFTVPQPDKYNIMIKGHEFCLKRSEVVTLYKKLLAILPYEKETALETIKIAVSRVFRVSLRDLNSPRRTERISVARFACIWLARRLGIHHEEIAESFARHYSLCSYATKAFERRMDRQPKLKAKMDNLQIQLAELLGDA